jgi:hypothetical protein|eukprot:COSAG01_NODE_491_length_16354_cov_26.550784_5_plen_49_part_00
MDLETQACHRQQAELRSAVRSCRSSGARVSVERGASVCVCQLGGVCVS